ncbi:MAG: ribosome maturation factor RimM [Rhizobiales bacterium]|mgnify:FL=1|nr:ribosome maturation factor RimM [Hyphomicrobiales bacterium]MBN9010280.1 ribosome maturation factor RimM [Hyphomicrobiales bacterium]
MAGRHSAPEAGAVPAPADAILVAQIGAAHGLKGEVRVKAFTADPQSLKRYSPLAARDGRLLHVEAARPAGASPDMLVVRFRGIADRDAAEALNRTELFVPRDRLPATEGEDEFYHADLIGLAAATIAGEALGTVIAVHNFGAGDILEIAPRRGPTLLVPFTRAIVPTVDIPGRRLTVDPPPGLFDEARPEDGEDTGA